MRGHKEAFPDWDERIRTTASVKAEPDGRRSGSYQRNIDSAEGYLREEEMPVRKRRTSSGSLPDSLGGTETSAAFHSEISRTRRPAMDKTVSAG